ncbi:MAG TPA: hypothetical protein VOB72_27525, partial [Candidatus Dormibacteraeota bacterium]|nr:hypothetical protein [Candidatus Dormibacteraeota bacterium]
MTDTDLRLVACQLGDCRNAAALTVTVELPTSWTESREYTTRTLLVAVCGDCAPVVEADARALLEARVRYATTAQAVDLTRLLLALIDAVGPPFEPEKGGTFATWIDKLDKPRAQSAWRLLAFVKRQTLEGKTIRDGWWRKARRAPGTTA